MTPHPDHVAASLNFAGFLCGLALYGMLLVMSVRVPVRRGTRRAASAAERHDFLRVATGALGVLWNLGAIVVYGIADLGTGPAPALLQAVAFSALGFLPAVAVHSVMRAWPRASWSGAARVVVGCAYALSAASAALLLASAAARVPVTAGFRALTVGFAVLIVPLVAMTRGEAGWRRALLLVALAVFAVSALHLGEHEDFTRPWWVELLVHHASLPLAIAILSQDYPFALGDLLLKRVLALGALVALSLAALLVLAASPAGTAPVLHADEPVVVIAFLVIAVGAAACYPWLHRGSSWFVDVVILRRVDRREVLAAIGRIAQEHDTPEGLLHAACARLASALSDSDVRWRVLGSQGASQEAPDETVRLAVGAWEASARTTVVTPAPDGRSATIVVPVSEAPLPVVLVGPLSRGRRLLSADIALLESVALLVGRRIDALRLAHERFERRFREQETSRLAAEAELRALRAQINPHFLFNALTTIGHLIQTTPPQAVQTLLRLTALLRRVLRSEGEPTTLGAELDLVGAYLDIERARFEDRLRVRIDVPASLREVAVPAFLLQPLVENAVKHGVAPAKAGADVSIEARLVPVAPAPRLEDRGTDAGGAHWPDAGDAGATRQAVSSPATDLLIRVSDTGAGVARAGRGGGAGVGLANLERRLAVAYGVRASLRFDAQPGRGARVEVRIPLDTVSVPPCDAAGAVSPGRHA